MSINLKAKETLIQVGDLKGTYRYVLATEIYGKLSAAKVIKEAALRSGISRGVMQACWDAAGEVIKAWATEGHSVAIPGLGTMRFGVRAKSVAAVADVATNLISARRVIFTPNVDIKDELASTSINITCYDRNGKEIKKVTSLPTAAMWRIPTTRATTLAEATPHRAAILQAVATQAVAILQAVAAMANKRRFGTGNTSE